jgi:hypothetical protein
MHPESDVPSSPKRIKAPSHPRHHPKYFSALALE